MKQIYMMLNLGRSYFKSGSILYSESQVRDAIPFLLLALEKYLLAYVIIITGKQQKLYTRKSLLRICKNDLLSKQIEKCFNTLDVLTKITEKSMTQLSDDKAKQLNDVFEDIKKTYKKINRALHKKYPSALSQWLVWIMRLIQKILKKA